MEQTQETKHRALAALAAAWDGQNNLPRESAAAFDPQLPAGRRVYESFSDEELLSLLQVDAQRLGHSPAQKEVFWVYREYMKLRFEKWPYALRRAGLCASAGKGGAPLAQSGFSQNTDTLLEQVRKAATALGRMPHPSDLPELCAALGREFRTWDEVLAAAEVRRVRTVCRLDDLDVKTQRSLDTLLADALSRGRAPLRSEIDKDTREALVQRCGSWRNALFQIGLEPVTHIHAFSGTKLAAAAGQTPRHGSTLYDCLYRVLRPNVETLADLRALVSLADALGHEPSRKEVSPELRRRLQNSCGSWANALFQIRYLKEPTDD